jgi:glycosyltransferase involved in cell wall biosynthesis
MQLKSANEAFRQNQFGVAMLGYVEAMREAAGLVNILRQNMKMTARRYRIAGSGLRVGVCGWSLTHNAAGRAHALARLYQQFADVELVGALFPKYGEGIWEPIRDDGIPIHTFRVDDHRQFVNQALELVAQHPYDVVHLAKPRMPNMLFGLLYKLIWGAQVIVDVDDNERAFARQPQGGRPELDPASIGALPAPNRLAAPKWTEIGQKLVSLFDGVTVSNPVLQDWFGGIPIRHARCEKEFDPDRFDRRLLRDRYDLAVDRRVVLFLGTPRPHKGLLESARAIRALGRDDVTFLIVGSFDKDARGLERELHGIDGLDLRFMPNQPFSAVPELVALADVCLALQHPDSDVSGAQVPAKLSDALAMGKPAIVSRNPALADLDLGGIALESDLDDLDEVLARALSGEWQNEERSRRIRELFLREFSVSANAERLEALVQQGERGDEWRLRRYMHRVLTHFPEFPHGLLETAEAQPVKAAGRPLAERRLEEILSQDCPAGLTETLESSNEGIRQAEQALEASGDQPLVSVIMPTHNRAAIIAEAIQSVVEQSWRHWELLVCDDASEDATADVVAQFDDPRIQYLKLEKQGAAAARNRGLELARGEVISYLDSDNMWRSGYLARMVWALVSHPGRLCAYANYLDYRVDRQGRIRVKAFERPLFDHERLLDKNYIDLNSFAHWRELYDCFGGFTESLPRRQDYDLIIKYTWLRDPLYIDDIVTLYQRNENLDQLTVTKKHENPLVERIIDGNIEGYLTEGLPLTARRSVQRVTVLSWDMSRNHFSKAYAVAEALAQDYDVQLISFRFFEEEIFPPLAGAEPSFETVYLQGSDFPDFFDAMRRALSRIHGDVIYVIKPRLPSLGLALLARHLLGTPVVLEINDLESVVQAPGRDRADPAVPLDKAQPDDAALRNPYSQRWSLLMEWAAAQLPTLTTHNVNIDAHFGNRCLYMRNFKDERVYDPERYDRQVIRRELGFSRSDRVILFGGLIRKHKGIYELVELVERLGDPRYKLLFVGSRISPDQKRLVAEYGDRITVLPPQDRDAMARINLAADLVVLWLDPDVPASHYQMPYKATDALAMGASVIANDISDLGDLARQGYLTLAPFGDWQAIEQAIQRVFSDRKGRRDMQDAGRRLFLRQFSYKAARAGFELAARRALDQNDQQAEVAEQFTEFFDAFYQVQTLRPEDFIRAQQLPPANLRAAIRTVESIDECSFEGLDKDGVLVVIGTEERGRGLQAARQLVLRAGRLVQVLVATLADAAQRNALARRALDESGVRYVVLAGDRVLPGMNWLQSGWQALEESGKGFLALNCGQGASEGAPFAMLRFEWAKQQDAVVGATSRSRPLWHELESLAQQQDQWLQHPDAVVFNLEPVEHYLEAVLPASAPSRAQKPGIWQRWLPWRRQQPAEQADASDPTEPGPGIELLDASHSPRPTVQNTDGVTVIMPAINRRRALATARMLRDRAGMDVQILVVLDTRRQGFVKTLNRTARRVKSRYLVYLAEDAVAGQDWVKLAWQRLEDSGKGLLAFNCGKWRGRIAAFGMVRCQWVGKLYSGQVLHAGYRAHRADNELTAIARATDQFIYCPEALLMENDPGKLVLDHGVEQSGKEDRRLFRQRYAKAFGGLAPADRLAEMADEYVNRASTLRVSDGAEEYENE